MENQVPFEDESYQITTDLEADKAVGRIKKINKANDRFEDLIKTKIEELKHQLEEFKKNNQMRIDFYTHHICQYLDSIDQDLIRRTKAGNKIYDLSEGKVTMSKRQTFTYDKSNPDFIHFILENDLPYVKTTEEVAWSDLKKELVVEEGMVIIKDAGLIIPDTLVKVEVKDEIKIG